MLKRYPHSFVDLRAVVAWCSTSPLALNEVSRGNSGTRGPLGFSLHLQVCVFPLATTILLPSLNTQLMSLVLRIACAARFWTRYSDLSKGQVGNHEGSCHRDPFLLAGWTYKLNSYTPFPRPRKIATLALWPVQAQRRQGRASIANLATRNCVCVCVCV